MSFGQLLSKLNQRSTPLIPKNKFFRFSLIVIALLSLALISKNTLAASNSFTNKKNAIKAGNNQEAWLNEAMGSNMVSVFVGLVGDSIPDEIFDVNADASIINQSKYYPGGAFGAMNRYIATLQTPPASGIEYIASIKDSFLGKPAYAQGVGFNNLQFLLPLWRGFRNTIYVISTIIFVIIGVMIMLRIKISPQAVITVQSAIPKLITTLILVTFSYAIAGLVIDLTNFLQAFVVAIFFSVAGRGMNTNLFPEIKLGSGFPVLGDVGNIVAGFLSIFNDRYDFEQLTHLNLSGMQILTYRAVPGWISLMMLGGLLGSIVTGFFAGGVLGSLGTTGSWVGDMVGRLVGGLGGGLIGALLIPLVIFIIVAIWLIKLYFGLLKCYVTLIFKIITGPLEIGMGAFPNSKIGFSTWITDVVANMAVFPVVTIFLILLNMIVDAVGQYGILSKPAWAPALISAGGISPAILGAAVGVAGLAMLCKLPELVPQYIFMIKPSPFGAAIGEGLSKNIITGVGSQISSGVQRSFQDKVGKAYEGYVSGPIGDRITQYTTTKFGLGKRKEIEEKKGQEGKISTG